MGTPGTDLDHCAVTFKIAWCQKWAHPPAGGRRVSPKATHPNGCPVFDTFVFQHVPLIEKPSQSSLFGEERRMSAKRKPPHAQTRKAPNSRRSAVEQSGEQTLCSK